MSSLTTAGSSMEEEEFHTRLSLEIGETSRSVRLFGELISPQDHGGGGDRQDQQRAPETGRKKRAAETISSSGGCGRQSKKARTTLHDENDGDRRSLSEGGSRKKLRLTGAQATMLEDSFRAHNILSHAQKHELARRVGLSARQVEVWFQNRRARTKLKQTEVDCELLRRWNDRLTDENARLRRDIAEHRAAAQAVSVLCPSCCGKKMAMVAGDVA